MRLLQCASLVWLLLNKAAASQLPLSPLEDDPATASTNLVDLLSQDAELSSFVHLLQRARLVPTLNRMADVTIYAPTNDALKDRGYLLEDSEQHDNFQYRLRERLFYHMLNYTADNLSFPDPQDNRIIYESTLLFPTTHEEHGRPGTVPYPEPQNTLLGGEGQKLAVLKQDGQPNRIGVNEAGEGGAGIVAGRGGKARNGRLIVIDAMLDPPKSLAHQIRARCLDGEDGTPNSLCKFASLLTEEMWKNLTESSHTTLFVPEDKAFDALDPLEWKYLTSGFAADDILQIARNHRTEYTGEEGWREKVGYLNRLLDVGTIPVASGDSVSVARGDDDKITINSSQVVTGNILTSNGVMHVIDSLLLPHGSLALTSEKYLLALNATKFVSLFRESGLSHLLQSSPHNNENNASYTILAAKDDVLERMLALPWASLPANGSKELKETLKYHVIEGKHTKKQLVNGSLLKTMLQTSQLGNKQQRIAVSVASGDDFASSRKRRGEKDSVEIAFGSASVIAEPIEAGNSIIYLISRLVEPPSSFVSTALDKGLSTFVASVYASGLDKKLLHGSPATTFLAPTNKAFDFMGLAMNYFLLPSAKQELGQMLRYHAIKGSVYLNELESDSERFETVEGSEIYLERNVSFSPQKHHHKGNSPHPHIRVRGPLVGGLPANGDNRPAKTREADLLTSTGVLHVIDQVELPPTLNVTSEKLMRGARASTFPDLLAQVNMSWIAEGKPAPEGFEESYALLARGQADTSSKKKKVFVHDSYTILCPTDKAFTRINLTHYLNDLPSLLALVQMHIIPSPSSKASPSSSDNPLGFPSDGRPLALVDDGTFSTLYSKNEGGSSRYGDVAFRKSGGSDWLVGIKGARGNAKNDAARILNSGRNTPIVSSRKGGEEDEGGEMDAQNWIPKMVFGGGVLLIDGVLEPYQPTWWQKWGYIAAIVVLGLAAATCIGLLAWKLYDRRKKQREHYETLPQENEED